MKAFFSIIFCLVIVGSAFGYQDYSAAESKDEAPPEIWCPATRISDNDKCMDCHAMRIDNEGKPHFGLKELKVDANYAKKPGAIDRIYPERDYWVAYMYVGGTNAAYFRAAADYLSVHPEIKKIVVEFNTPGGSIMDAWRAVGIIKEMQSRGVIVETRVYGLSASAGVVLMVAGDIGHRFVNPNAEIMIHKVWTFKMFSLDTPDSAEDEANTLKHFQSNINSFILSRSKMTKKQLDECIFKKDFWMTGKVAVEYGLADGLIGD